jgi:hypothetical protein
MIPGRNRESRSREAAGRRNSPEAVSRKMSGRKRVMYRIEVTIGGRTRVRQPKSEKRRKAVRYYSSIRSDRKSNDKGDCREPLESGGQILPHINLLGAYRRMAAGIHKILSRVDECVSSGT